MNDQALTFLGYAGLGLRRPECVVCTPSGSIYASHSGGGIMKIAADGAQTLVGSDEASDLVPNGFALLKDGSFLVANMGDAGGLWSIALDGAVRACLREVDGCPLTSVNFVLVDGEGGSWMTVSTRTVPRAQSFSTKVADGYIVRLDGKGSRIVADGLCFANECRVAPDGRHLYVSETFARRIARYPIGADGSLGEAETFADLPAGAYPDGIAFDAEGHLWVASIVSNRIYRIAPDGSSSILLDEADSDHVARADAARDSNSLTPDLILGSTGPTLKNVSSIAFVGPDFRSVVFGSLSGDRLPVYRSPVAGLPLPHWHWTQD